LRFNDRDGLITNGKFCFSRPGKLKLNWWRRPLRLLNTIPALCDTLLEKDPDPGGDDEAGMGHPQANGSAERRATSLGHDLSMPSEVGTSGDPGGIADADFTGGAACE
jgi:hypothetical protein